MSTEKSSCATPNSCNCSSYKHYIRKADQKKLLNDCCNSTLPKIPNSFCILLCFLDHGQQKLIANSDFKDWQKCMCLLYFTVLITCAKNSFWQKYPNIKLPENALGHRQHMIQISYSIYVHIFVHMNNISNQLVYAFFPSSIKQRVSYSLICILLVHNMSFLNSHITLVQPLRSIAY